jgi:hypothetical protein
MKHPYRRRPAHVLRALPAALAFLVFVPVAHAQQGEDKARDKKAFFDSRQTPGSLKELRGRAGPLPPAAAALEESLGVEGVVSIDPLTATARFVGRTDGFLTGPSNLASSTIALDFVAGNATALGLTSQGLKSLSSCATTCRSTARTTSSTSRRSTASPCSGTG